MVILGAGSIGCFIGGAWLAAGCSVSFVGRERIRDDIAANGLALSDHAGWRVHLAHDLIDFSTRPAALAKADIVALCVKSSDTAAAAKQIATHGKKKPVVISFQNGVGNADTLRTLLPKLEVVQGMVPFNVANLGKGRFHKGTSGELVAGETEATRALRAAADGRLRLGGPAGGGRRKGQDRPRLELKAAPDRGRQASRRSAGAGAGRPDRTGRVASVSAMR